MNFGANVKRKDNNIALDVSVEKSDARAFHRFPNRGPVSPKDPTWTLTISILVPFGKVIISGNILMLFGCVCSLQKTSAMRKP